MLRTLVLVATISGLLVVLSYRVTLPFIEHNKQMAIEKALYKVIPDAKSRRDFVISGQSVTPADDSTHGVPLYAGYDANGKLKGVALETAAAGYGGVIRALFGYDPYCQCITGIEILQMAETPGIGDKIIKDAEFVKNFESLQARPHASGKGLENAIVAVKHGSKTDPWQIDAISGATISSTAVARMLNDSGQQYVPLIINNLTVLEETN
jgi:electron transport complex protein RnfG